LKYILKIIKHLKALHEIDLAKRQKNYLKLKDGVESFIRFHKMPLLMDRTKGEKKLDEDLLDKLNQLLRSFKEVDNSEEIKGIEWNNK
jgi:hypothetical protein